jgi:mycofactocin system glycosyltransferase
VTGPLRLRADVSLGRLAGGRTLLGGAPLRALRLSATGAGLVERWLAAEPVADVPAHRALAARLVRIGMVHPEYPTGRWGPADVTVVVPVRDHAEALRPLLAALADEPDLGGVIVVDDGSAEPVPGAAVRHPVARGPAAARNAGWRRVGTEFVAFLDADTVPEPGWLGPLLRQFTDPDVAAAAPRVCSPPGKSTLQRYEQVRSSLDLGPAPAVVRPGSRVSYVPTAALLVRTEALRGLDGFDESMRFGEDVDLVWRLAAGDGLVRYEPESVVWHAPRATWSRWLRQRFEYGTSAAGLARRHGSAVAPVRVSVWSALAWVLVAAGRPVAGVGVAGVTAALLPRKLAPVGVPAAESVSLALRGHLGAGRLLGDAVTRSWAPFAVPVLAASRRGRLVLLAAFARHLLDWRRTRPPLDAARWTLIRSADDLAYGTGVCWGAVREHTLGPLRPDLSDWPGRTGIQT